MNNNFLFFKKAVKEGQEFYILVKDLNFTERVIWKPEKKIIGLVTPTGGVYDKEGIRVEDDLLKFDTLEEASLYCEEINKPATTISAN